MMSYTYAQPNTVSHQVYKYSRLGQFAAQTIQFRQVNSFTEDTPKAIKHFIPMATHSFLVPTHLMNERMYLYTAHITYYYTSDSL